MFITRCRNKDLNLESKLRQVGIKEEDLPMMAEAAMIQQRLLVNNPREVTQQDALDLYQLAH
jgi:alcohol dehydrogenase